MAALPGLAPRFSMSAILPIASTLLARPVKASWVALCRSFRLQRRIRYSQPSPTSVTSSKTAAAMASNIRIERYSAPLKNVAAGWATRRVQGPRGSCVAISMAW